MFTINACLGVLYFPEEREISNDASGRSSVSLAPKLKKVLLCCRPKGKIYAGYWEFPGGKLEKNETAFVALARELNEELGIMVQLEDMYKLDVIEHEYPHGVVKLDVILVKRWQGKISAKEGQGMKWHSVAEELPTPALPTTEKIFSYL